MAAIIEMVCTAPQKSLPQTAEEFTVKAGLSGERIYSHRREDAVLLCFERYYFRNGSYAALTVSFREQDGRQYAAIVGFGGAEGLFNLSWGANASFARTAQQALELMGFEKAEEKDIRNE